MCIVGGSGAASSSSTGFSLMKTLSQSASLFASFTWPSTLIWHSIPCTTRLSSVSCTSARSSSPTSLSQRRE